MNFESIYGTIIQGMSGILGITIAFIIFRIQTLETRNMNSQESVLNYIFNIIGWTYPDWTQDVIDTILDRSITNRYYQSRIYGVEDEERIRLLVEERDRQQARLETTLIRINLRNTAIKKLRNDFRCLAAVFVSPIILSFIMLMFNEYIPDAYDTYFLFGIVILSIYSIFLLVKLVLDSTSDLNELIIN